MDIHKRGGVSIGSDFAKKHLAMMAMFASQGLISTELPQKHTHYGRMWRLTAQGLVWLEGAR